MHTFDIWNRDGILDAIHDALFRQCRQAAKCDVHPSAAIIDSQSVKSAEKGGSCIDPHGHDAGKKINGKKRHVVVDTLGLLLRTAVLPADIRDRNGGITVLSRPASLFPYLRTPFADGAYQGPLFNGALEKILPRLRA